MQYELRPFDRLISGDLCPRHTTAQKQTFWQEYLHQRDNVLTKQFVLVGQVDSEDNFVIQTKRLRYLSSSTSTPWSDTRFAVGQEPTTNHLVTQVLPQLGVQRSEVKQALCWNDERGVHLELYVQQDTSKLTSDELRFAFYLSFLEECTLSTKQKLTDTICQLASDKKARKYVQNHQNILVGLCRSVTAQLGEEDRQHIYCASDELNTSDIYKLIFQSLEDITAHLEQHFTRYLDVRAYVPYRSRVVTFGQMVKKFTAVQQVLQQSSVSSELLATLEKPFERIENLKTEQTTYAELLYLKKFIQELGCLVERDSVNDYRVAETLFRINFNRPAFLAWLMSQLDHFVQVATSVHDKLEVLYHYSKLSKQVSFATKQAYQPELPNLDRQIRQYIDEDIERYQQQLAVVDTTTEVASFSPETSELSGADRISTPLTVVQLAHLLCLLFEVKVFPKGKKKTVFGWFARMVATPRVGQLSTKSLYDRQYEADDATRQTVQELLQQMMNLSRKRKAFTRQPLRLP